MKRKFLPALLTCLAVTLPACVRAADEPAKSTAKPVVAVFSLRGPITEKPASADFPFALEATGESLKELIERLEKAGEDDAVKAIVLLPGLSSPGRAQTQELLQAMEKIKAAGKPIHVHLDLAMTRQYVLASGASRISMVPTGYMFLTGLYGEQVFVRGLLEKIGVTPDYFTNGKYKSAAEMLMRKSPSPESAEMQNWIFDGLYGDVLNDIAKGRKVPAETAREWIDHGVFLAKDAKAAGIIDAVEHRQDFEAHLRKTYGEDVKLNFNYGKKKGDTIDFSSPMGILSFYAKLLSPPRRVKSTKPSVAIVYLEGAIMPGVSSGGMFDTGGAYSTTIRRTLDKVAEDDSIKAVVFRVNSPGGSAVASEIILDATRRVAAKKPFVVSMGDVAGSGGYYVACGAKTIFADSSTITGSIGVVAGKFSTTGMWDKIGISFTPYKRGKNAAILSSADVFSDSERAALRGYMDDVYGVFKQHVVNARGDRLTKKIDDLAGGRVYTGRQALELGLVDKLGGLNDAVAFAGKQAKLESYEIRVVPRTKNPIEQLMEQLTGDSSEETQRLQIPLSLATGNQADVLWTRAMPLLKGLKGGRVEAVMQVLQQMSLMEREGVLLSMPVWAMP